MVSGKSILVTGSHRSGTTWVGKMIAASPSVGYIQEPFFPGRRPGICGVTFPYPFAYVTDDNGEAFYHHMDVMLAFRFRLGAALAAVKTPKDAAIVLKYGTQFCRSRARRAIPLMKDPLAVFSTEWLARRFNMRVIVMVRHPAAFACSIRRASWRHDFSTFLQQPLLMRDYLFPYEEEIRAFVKVERDILDQAAFLWKLIYSVVHKCRQAYPDWILLRHEDLANDPLGQFASVFQKLDLDYSPHVQHIIEDYSNPANPVMPRGGSVRFGRRNSKAVARYWQAELTGAEITRLRRGVGEIADAFYLDSDWDIR